MQSSYTADTPNGVDWISSLKVIREGNRDRPEGFLYLVPFVQNLCIITLLVSC